MSAATMNEMDRLRRELDEAYAKGKQAFEDLRRVEAERDVMSTEHAEMDQERSRLRLALIKAEIREHALAAHVDSLTGITEYTAPCVFHGNAHADCVQHSGQAPCMTQTESDWLAEIQKAHNALAAQLDRPRIKILGDLLKAGIEPEDIFTSLAHLKAQWQADAVSEYAFHHLGGHEQEHAEIYAGKLRRQAEEPTNGSN